MKRLTLFLFFCVYILNTNAQQVTLSDAQIAATYAMLEEYEEEEREYIIKELSVTETNTYSVKDTTFMYEVLFNNGKGILLSGNKNCLPVLGHLVSAKVSIFSENTSCCLTDFLESYVYQIRESFVDKQGNVENIEKWHNLLAGKINKAPSYEVVSPLTKSTWGQSEPNEGSCKAAYNNDVEETSVTHCSKCKEYKCAAGCVAVAMAQIMYYHKYPMKYDWCNMADSVISAKLRNCRDRPVSRDPVTGQWEYKYICDTIPYLNYETERNAVARLIRDCGLEVKMEYCRGGKKCGSGAYTKDTEKAFQNYGYNAKYKKWNNIKVADIKANLNNNRPVLFSASNGKLGHAFVCDGYRSDNFFHFNWGNGRNGNNDQWLTLDNLYYVGVDFLNKYTEAVLDIYPTKNFDHCNYNITIPACNIFNPVPKYPTNLIIDFNNTPDNTIYSGKNVEYFAHNSIVIKPGFRAAAGSKVRMHIEPCANCPKTSSPSSAPPRPNADFESENEDFNISNLESNISVFPNPTTGIVNIISQNTKIESISVFDISGKILQNNTAFTGNTLDLSWLSNGVYFIKIKTLSEQTTHKVIIQK